LPKLRKFVKDKGHAEYYPGLKINFIPGRKPELVCFQAEEEVERIEMEKMTTEEAHELVQSKGYKRIMPVVFARRMEQGEEVSSEEWNEYLEALKKVDRRIKDAKRHQRPEDKIDKMDAKFDALEEKFDAMEKGEKEKANAEHDGNAADGAAADSEDIQKKAGEAIDKVMADPELKAMVDENPKLQKILEEVKVNPMAGMQYMMDPEVSPFLQKAMAKMSGEGALGNAGMPDLSGLMGGMPGGKGAKGGRRKKGKSGGTDPMGGLDMSAMMGMLGGLGGKGGGKGGKKGGKGGMPDLSALMGGMPGKDGGKGGMPDLSAMMGGGDAGMPDLSEMMGGEDGGDGMDALDGMFKELGGLLKDLKAKGGPEAEGLEGLDEELAEFMADFGDDDMGDVMGDMGNLMGGLGGIGADDIDSAEHTEL